MNEPSKMEARIAAYCRRHQLERLGPLGSGMHGNVFRAGRPAAAGEVALRVHVRREPFALELETYLRLKEANVAMVHGFNVPQLLDYDADLLVLEMTVVQQPFVLDFAEVRLDFPMEFPDDVWTHWREEKQERFGERWTAVVRVLGEFDALDIYLLDVSPRNIAFRD